MTKDSFFDTNVIINYGKFTKNTRLKIIIKCYEYILNKKGKFIICYSVEEEIEKVIKKNKIIHKEMIEKVKDSSYEIGSSIEGSLLKAKDIAYAKKMYEIKKQTFLNVLSNSFLEEETYLEMNIEHFLKIKIDQKVVPINQIDGDLVNKIYGIIPNHADSKILASAIQLQSQEGRKIFLFVTADGKDLDPNGYEFLKEHFEINYSKEKWKFPELLNFMFVD